MLAGFITELILPKTPASVGGGFQRAVKSSMDSANIQRGLNPPLNEVLFKGALLGSWAACIGYRVPRGISGCKTNKDGIE
ncbi:MAG: hypothetical protein AB1815_12010 [Bacillota bacterium]|jgi:hypothetical protein